MSIFKSRLILRENMPLKDFNLNNVSAGLASGLLAITGPPALILAAALNGNFTTEQTIMWMFSVHVFGGIFSILLPLYYRMPIVGAHSISAVAFLATVTTQFPYPILIGSYIFSGLLMLLIGYLGAFSKLMNYVPKEIIASMLAGMIIKYLINFVVSINQVPMIGMISLIVYFIFSKWNRWIHPMLAAIATAFILLFLTQPLGNIAWISSIVFPHIQPVQLDLLSLVSVSIPLAILILTNDAAVGLGALEQNGYHPPANRVILFSGVFSIIAGLFGGQSANVAGMMSAICSDEEAGPKEKRYIGAVVSGIIILTFGLFASKLVPFILALPKEFVSILVGFALLGVFANSLHVSFSQPNIKISTAFAFIVAVSNVTVFHVSAPVWSLLAGSLIARYVEGHKPT